MNNTSMIITHVFRVMVDDFSRLLRKLERVPLQDVASDFANAIWRDIIFFGFDAYIILTISANMIG